MARKEDIAAQLELTNALNKALERQLELQTKLSAGASKQAQLMGDMANAASKSGTSGIEKRIANQRKLTAEIENTRKKSADMTNELQRGMKKQADSIGGSMKAFGGVTDFLTSWKGMALGALGGIVGGVAKTMSGITGLIKGFFSVATSLVKFSMGVIKGLIMAPFKLMDAFNGIAQEMHRINIVINGARQAVRGMIGDHESHGSSAGKAYKFASGAIKKYGKGLYEAHEQGTASRMKDQGELVKFFGVYRGEMKKGNEVARDMAFLMKRGMGMNAEDAESLIGMSKAFGEDINEVFKDTVAGLGNMANELKVDIKTLSKDFMIFHNKLKPLTGMSTRQLQEMTGVFTKMGISADKAFAMFDNFNTLEGGAETVAKMSRSLGIHLSQTQMIMAREKGPLEQMKLVQQSMRMAGKGMEDLSYDGKRMLAEMFGGDANVAMKAFSRDALNSTGSLEQAAKAAAKAKKAKDLPTIMKSVQRSIQGVADSFGKIMKPLEAFMFGFMRGMNDGKFVKNMMTISTVFRQMGVSFGKFFKETGLLEKISKSLAAFATKIKEVMPFVEELLANLFTDQPRSQRSAWEVIKDISSTLLGAYSDFYNDVIYFVISAAQKVIPVIIKMASFLAGSLNDVLVGSMTGDFTNLTERFAGMADVDFDDDRLNKAYKEMANTSSRTFNNEFMKTSKRYVATDGKMQLRRVGLGEALIDNLGEAIKRGFKKIGSLIWEGIKSAFTNIPGPVLAYLAMAIAGLFLPGGAIMVALATAIGVGIGAAVNAIGDAFSDRKAFESARKFSQQTREEINKRGEDLKIDVANKVAATKGLIKEMKKLLDDEIVSTQGKSSLNKGMQILSNNAAAIAAASKKATDARADLAGAKFSAAFEPGSLELLRGQGMGGSEDTVVKDNLFQTQTLMTGDGRKFQGNIRELIGLARTGNDSAISKLGGILQQGGYGGWKLNEIKEATANLDIVDGGIEIETGDENLLFQHLIKSQASIAKKVSEAADAYEKRLKTNQTADLVATFKNLRFVERQSIINAAAEARASGNADEKAKGEELTRVLNHMPGAYDYSEYTSIIETLASAELEKLEQLRPDSKFIQSIIRQANAAENPMEEYNRLLKEEATRRAGEYATSLDNKIGGELDKNTIRDLTTAAELYTRYMKNPEKLLMEDPAAMRAIDAVTNAGGDISNRGDFIKRLSKQVGGAPLKAQLQKLRAGKDEGLKGPAGSPKGAKELSKKMKSVGGKAAKSGKVGVKPVKKAAKLGRLPTSVLKMLANRRTVKRILGAGLEITTVLDKLGPAGDSVAKALGSKAVPAIRQTATAAHQATEALAGTIVALGIVHDKIADIQLAYKGIATSIVNIKQKSDGLKGSHSKTIKSTESEGVLTVNVNVKVDSQDLSAILSKTSKVVTWTGKP